ncbi:MAG TPA: AraC family transcriptional regulator ligand-binding domain-containing protein [Sphingobacteriaceae bacterium]
MDNSIRSFVLSFLAYASLRDVDSERLCELSGISYRKLIAEENYTVSPVQIRSLWQNAVYLTKDDLFGLHFGESLQLAALGIVGEIIKSSNTVGEALDIAASLTHLITDLFHIKIARHPGTFSVLFIPQSSNWKTDVVCRQVLDMLMAFVIHEMDGLVLQKIVPLSFSYTAELIDEEESCRVMRCKMDSNRNEISLSFENKYLNEPILSANYELQNILIRKVHTLAPGTGKARALKTSIFNYLLSNSYLGILSLEQVASNFNMSGRTIQRRLKEESTSYQQVADDVRKTIAINYLQSGSYPLKQISFLMGYNELSAFSRSFKRWTGKTPASYQKIARP